MQTQKSYHYEINGILKRKRRVCSMSKILSTYICRRNIYKMQHLEGSGTPVLYMGRRVLKG